MSTSVIHPTLAFGLALLAGLTACNTPDPNLTPAIFPDRIAFTATRQYPDGITYERTKMSRVTSSDGWRTATIAQTDVNGYEDATTNTEVNGAIYALNARISETSAAATANTPSSLTANSYSIKKFRP